MSRFHLVLALLAAVLFVGAYLIVSGSLPESGGPLDYRSDREGEAAAERGIEGGTMRGKEGITTEPLPRDAGSDVLEADEEAIDDPEFGALAGRVLTDDGSVPGALGIAFAPQGGHELQNAGGEFEIVRLQPGAYKVTVWGADYVPTTVHDVRITAGRRRRVTVRLERGVRPRGRVVDEVDGSGIEGAEITFLGGVRTVSGAGGAFEAPHALRNEALSKIALRHPGYDDVVHRDLPAQDADAMQLPMTRGDSLLTVSLVNRTGAPWPARGRLRLSRIPGGTRRELRREVLFDPRRPHRFERIHYGLYEVTVDFPGAEFAQRSRQVRIEARASASLEIAFDAGTRLEGTLRSRGAVVGGRKVELVDDDGFVRATTTSAPDGGFSIPSVEPGTYRVKVWMGLPCFNTPAFEVGDERTRRLVIDCDRQLIAN